MPLRCRDILPHPPLPHPLEGPGASVDDAPLSSALAPPPAGPGGAAAGGAAAVLAALFVPSPPRDYEVFAIGPYTRARDLTPPKMLS